MESMEIVEKGVGVSELKKVQPFSLPGFNKQLGFTEFLE